MFNLSHVNPRIKNDLKHGTGHIGYYRGIILSDNLHHLMWLQAAAHCLSLFQSAM